jgi:hypothetical protein
LTVGFYSRIFANPLARKPSLANRPFSWQREHVPKKLPGFFDSGMLQIFDFERFLFDHVIPREWGAL